MPKRHLTNRASEMQLPTPRCPQLISLLPELSAAGCQNGCNCRGQASWALRPVMTTTGFGASFFADDVPSSGGAVITKKIAVTKIKQSCNHREFVGSFKIFHWLMDCLMPSEDLGCLFGDKVCCNLIGGLQLWMRWSVLRDLSTRCIRG